MRLCSRPSTLRTDLVFELLQKEWRIEAVYTSFAKQAAILLRVITLEGRPAPKIQKMLTAHASLAA